MSESPADILRRLARPLEPIPTGLPPRCPVLPGVRAVLFDVYGTLFISGSGDVGTTREAACEEAMAEALRACGSPPAGPLERGVALFFAAIERSHARSRARGIDHPEVDIVEIWADVVGGLAREGLIPERHWEKNDLQRLAVEYEGGANPVWPMPGLRECLESLRGLTLGIVSNAQFYTPLLFDALLGAPVDAWGFDLELQHYSYRHGRAKPGTELYAIAAGVLGDRGISPGEAVYVGNDMLNDVMPSAAVGFRTVLFAGDARSLRLREADPRIDGVSPDAVITELGRLPGCLGR
jgi:putative hydrolase of the HAD superfamily